MEEINSPETKDMSTAVLDQNDTITQSILQDVSMDINDKNLPSKIIFKRPFLPKSTSKADQSFNKAFNESDANRDSSPVDLGLNGRFSKKRFKAHSKQANISNPYLNAFVSSEESEISICRTPKFRCKVTKLKNKKANNFHNAFDSSANESQERNMIQYKLRQKVNQRQNETELFKNAFYSSTDESVSNDNCRPFKTRQNRKTNIDADNFQDTFNSTLDLSPDDLLAKKYSCQKLKSKKKLIKLNNKKPDNFKNAFDSSANESQEYVMIQSRLKRNVNKRQNETECFKNAFYSSADESVNIDNNHCAFKTRYNKEPNFKEDNFHDAFNSSEESKGGKNNQCLFSRKINEARNEIDKDFQKDFLSSFDESIQTEDNQCLFKIRPINTPNSSHDQFENAFNSSAKEKNSAETYKIDRVRKKLKQKAFQRQNDSNYFENVFHSSTDESVISNHPSQTKSANNDSFQGAFRSFSDESKLNVSKCGMNKFNPVQSQMDYSRNNEDKMVVSETNHNRNKYRMDAIDQESHMCKKSSNDSSSFRLQLTDVSSNDSKRTTQDYSTSQRSVPNSQNKIDLKTCNSDSGLKHDSNSSHLSLENSCSPLDSTNRYHDSNSFRAVSLSLQHSNNISISQSSSADRSLPPAIQDLNSINTPSLVFQCSNNMSGQLPRGNSTPYINLQASCNYKSNSGVSSFQSSNALSKESLSSNSMPTSYSNMQRSSIHDVVSINGSYLALQSSNNTSKQSGANSTPYLNLRASCNYKSNSGVSSFQSSNAVSKQSLRSNSTSYSNLQPSSNHDLISNNSSYLALQHSNNTFKQSSRTKSTSYLNLQASCNSHSVDVSSLHHSNAVHKQSSKAHSISYLELQQSGNHHSNSINDSSLSLRHSNIVSKQSSTNFSSPYLELLTNHDLNSSNASSLQCSNNISKQSSRCDIVSERSSSDNSGSHSTLGISTNHDLDSSNASTLQCSNNISKQSSRRDIVSERSSSDNSGSHSTLGISTNHDLDSSDASTLQCSNNISKQSSRSDIISEESSSDNSGLHSNLEISTDQDLDSSNVSNLQHSKNVSKRSSQTHLSSNISGQLCSNKRGNSSYHLHSIDFKSRKTVYERATISTDNELCNPPMPNTLNLRPSLNDLQNVCPIPSPQHLEKSSSFENCKENFTEEVINKDIHISCPDNIQGNKARLPLRPINPIEIKKFVKYGPFSELRPKKKILPDYSKDELDSIEILQNKATQKTSKKLVKINEPRKHSLYKPKGVKWVTKILYEFLFKKLLPEYGIKYRLEAKKLVMFMVDKVSEAVNKSEGYEVPVRELKMELARMKVIETNQDFFAFVREYLDEDFYCKSVPHYKPFGKQYNIEYVPGTMDDKILES